MSRPKNRISLPNFSLASAESRAVIAAFKEQLAQPKQVVPPAPANRLYRMGEMV